MPHIGKFTAMMDMRDVLKIIDAWLAATGETDTSLSRKATGSSDTIRNWRRAVRDGRHFGASTKSLQAVAEVVGFDVNLQGPVHEQDAKDFAEFLRLLPQASAEARAAALTTLRLGQKRKED